LNSKTLSSYQPHYYQKSLVMQDMNQVLAYELTCLFDRIQETENQFFLETADSSLHRWEWELGLLIAKAREYPYRRAKIFSKLLGQETTTVAVIQRIGESFTNRPAFVIEHYQEYYFTLLLQDVDDILSTIKYVKSAIEEIKPCHLGLVFSFLYEIPDPAEVFAAAYSLTAEYITIEPFLEPRFETDTAVFSKGTFHVGNVIEIQPWGECL